MAIESVKTRVLNTSLDGRSKEELYILLTNLITGLQVITAKLDADAGVTDTDYTAKLATYVSI